MGWGSMKKQVNCDWCVDVCMQPENKVLTWLLPSFLYVQETSSNLLD